MGGTYKNDSFRIGVIIMQKFVCKIQVQKLAVGLTR